jgi:hypothetical protein
MLLVRRGIEGSRLHPVVGRGIDREAATSKDARRVELIDHRGTDSVLISKEKRGKMEHINNNCQF